MECQKCNKDIPEDSKFCVYCGNEVLSEIKKTTGEDRGNNSPKIILEVKNHLEFIGYEIGNDQIEDGGVVRFFATNDNRPNLFISYLPFASAIVFVANYSIPKIESQSKKQKILEVANHINNELAAISTVGVGKNFDSIVFSTWYPDEYIKKSFAGFLDVFQAEISRLSSYEGLKALIK